MITRRNKKADMFAIGMVLAMIIFMGTAWLAFSQANNKIKSGFEVVNKYSELKNLKDAQIFYINESTKLAASQAFYELAKATAIKETLNCDIFGNNIIIWDQNCKPDIENIEETFIKEYGESLIEFMENASTKQNIEYYHEFEEDNNILKSTASEQTIEMQEKSSFATYNISIKFNPSTQIDLEQNNILLQDFIDMYEISQDIKNNCETESIISCSNNKLKNNLDNWNIFVEKNKNYLIATLETKNSFFFFDNEENKEKFEPIMLKFALEI